MRALRSEEVSTVTPCFYLVSCLKSTVMQVSLSYSDKINSVFLLSDYALSKIKLHIVLFTR